MEPDLLNDLVVFEREHERARECPRIWTAVTSGEVDPHSVSAAQAGDVPSEQLARDRELFRPLDAPFRQELLAQLVEPRAEVIPLRVRGWRPALASVVATVVATAAALALVFSGSAKPPFLDRNVDLELLAGESSLRTADSSTPSRAEVHTLSTGQRSRLHVRMAASEFAVTSVAALCEAGEVPLTHTLVSSRPGHVEVEVQVSAALGPRCELEVMVRVGEQVWRVPQEHPVVLGGP